MLGPGDGTHQSVVSAHSTHNSVEKLSGYEDAGTEVLELASRDVFFTCDDVH